MKIFFENMTSYTDAIKKSNRGVCLSLHVIPGSSQTVFPLKYDQWRKSIEIKVRPEPKDNKANTEIIKIIAEFFGLSMRDIILVHGEKNRQKTICLKKISVDEVTAKLQGSFHE